MNIGTITVQRVGVGGQPEPQPSECGGAYHVVPEVTRLINVYDNYSKLTSGLPLVVSDVFTGTADEDEAALSF